VIRATDTDDHLSRTYHNTATNENVAIFVGYGGRYRDLTPHQPEVCFVGSGWVMQGIKRYDLPLDSGATLPCRVLSFTKTGFTDERVAVADFYIIDGSFAPDVTKLRAQGLRLKPTANYAAQVQITHEPRRMNEEGSAPVRAFAAIVAPRLRDLLETAVAASKHKQGATTP
jgi:hypothetical protein